MTDKRALTLPRRLIARYKTRDPFRLCEQLAITVLLRGDFVRQKGAFKVIANNSFIFISSRLSEPMQRLVCAHELGHALLHRKLGCSSAGLLEFEVFNITDQCEYDANAFAANLLLDDAELMDYIREGRDAVQIARAMDTNVNLVLLRIGEMTKSGGTFVLPVSPSKRFLSDIPDNAGEI